MYFVKYKFYDIISTILQTTKRQDRYFLTVHFLPILSSSHCSNYKSLQKKIEKKKKSFVERKTIITSISSHFS